MGNDDWANDIDVWRHEMYKHVTLANYNLVLAQRRFRRFL
jgi:hypothetical protein